MPSYTTGKPEERSEFHVPAGDYSLEVIEAKEDTSKSSGADMLKVKLRVIKEDGSKGVSLFDYLVFSKTSFWKIDGFLKSAGVHPGEGKAINVEADDVIGYKVRATLKVEEYDGKKSNKVEAYLWEEF